MKRLRELLEGGMKDLVTADQEKKRVASLGREAMSTSLKHKDRRKWTEGDLKKAGFAFNDQTGSWKKKKSIGEGADTKDDDGIPPFLRRSQPDDAKKILRDKTKRYLDHGFRGTRPDPVKRDERVRAVREASDISEISSKRLADYIHDASRSSSVTAASGAIERGYAFQGRGYGSHGEADRLTRKSFTRDKYVGKAARKLLARTKDK